MQVYRIVNWNAYFENNRSRELKSLDWVPFPNKHSGDGYTELVCEHENGPAHFAAWVVLVQVASRCDVRGTLMRSTGKPHDSESLSRITRLPTSLFNEAVPRLLEIGWVEQVTVDDDDTCNISQDDATKSQGDAIKRLRNGTEKKGKNIHARFDEWWSVYPRKTQKQTARAAYQRAIKRIAESQQLNGESPAEWLLERTQAFSRSDKAKGDFCPYPATWLNQGRYEDDPREWGDDRSPPPKKKPPSQSEILDNERYRLVKEAEKQGKPRAEIDKIIDLYDRKIAELDQ